MAKRSVGRDLTYWQEQIQAVIDNSIDTSDWHYKRWHKDELKNFGFKLRKDAIHGETKPWSFIISVYQGIEQYRTVQVPFYDVSQFEPFQGLDFKKYTLWKMLTLDNEPRYAVRIKNFTNIRPEAKYPNHFDWRNEPLSYNDFVAHFSGNKKAKDRYLIPNQEETLFLIVDFDCHDHSANTRNHYAYSVETFYKAMESKPDIFGWDYRVALNCRQSRPGTHALIMFKPDRALSSDIVSVQLRQFITELGLNPNIEIYPSEPKRHKLILSPLALTHTFIADKPYMKQTDKVNTLHRIWWEWQDYQPMAWQDAKEYLLSHSDFPELPEGFIPDFEHSRIPEMAEKPKNVPQQKHRYSKSIDIKVPLGSVQLAKSNFPTFKKGEWNPLLHKNYQRDPSELRDGDGRNIYVMSMWGFDLLQLNRRHNNNVSFDLFAAHAILRNQALAKPLDDAEIMPRIHRIYYKYQNKSIASPSISSNPMQNRTNPSDLAIVGNNFQRSDAYKKQGELIEESFFNAVAPLIQQGTNLDMLVLEHVTNLVIEDDITGKLRQSAIKPQRHKVGDLIRHHCQSADGSPIKGVKRTINGKKCTVYYGLKLADKPNHAYNPKTKRAIFKYKNTVYRIFADSPEHAEQKFYQMVHESTIDRVMRRGLESSPLKGGGEGMGSRHVPFRAVRPEIRKIQDHDQWQMDVEDRLKQTYHRRYGKKLTKRLE